MANKNYSITLSFENISLPPFEDILILTQKSPHGKIGIADSLTLLQPDRFEFVEVNDEMVETLVVNRVILKRIPAPRLIEILRERIYPYLVKGEIVKVDFNVKISYDNLEFSIKDTNES